MVGVLLYMNFANKSNTNIKIGEIDLSTAELRAAPSKWDEPLSYWDEGQPVIIASPDATPEGVTTVRNIKGLADFLDSATDSADGVKKHTSIVGRKPAQGEEVRVTFNEPYEPPRRYTHSYDGTSLGPDKLGKVSYLDGVFYGIEPLDTDGGYRAFLKTSELDADGDEVVRIIRNKYIKDYSTASNVLRATDNIFPHLEDPDADKLKELCSILITIKDQLAGNDAVRINDPFFKKLFDKATSKRFATLSSYIDDNSLKNTALAKKSLEDTIGSIEVVEETRGLSSLVIRAGKNKYIKVGVEVMSDGGYRIYGFQTSTDGVNFEKLLIQVNAKHFFDEFRLLSMPVQLEHPSLSLPAGPAIIELYYQTYSNKELTLGQYLLRFGKHRVN